LLLDSRREGNTITHNAATEAGGSRIARLLEGTGPERRAGLRHQTQLTAIFRDRRSVAGELVTSISSWGLFIETLRPPGEGAIVPILVGLLPDGKPPLEIDVEVIRVQPPSPAERGGVEVRLVGAAGEYRARIEAYLRGLRR
jgi:hypothetical protein